VNISNCYYAGLAKRMTDDWTGAIETTALMLVLAGLGIGISASYAIEIKLQRAVTRVEEALHAVEANHLGRLEANNNLRIGQETLEKIRRARSVLLSTMAVLSVSIVPRYCAIGCPGFDVWSEIKSEFRQIGSWTLSAPYSTSYTTNRTS